MQVYDDEKQMFWACNGYQLPPMYQQTLSNIMRVTFVTDDQYNKKEFVIRYVFKGINIVMYVRQHMAT